MKLFGHNHSGDQGVGSDEVPRGGPETVSYIARKVEESV